MRNFIYRQILNHLEQIQSKTSHGVIREVENFHAETINLLHKTQNTSFRDFLLHVLNFAFFRIRLVSDEATAINDWLGFGIGFIKFLAGIYLFQ